MYLRKKNEFQKANLCDMKNKFDFTLKSSYKATEKKMYLDSIS